MPYNYLINEGIRCGTNLHVTDSIVIIDEAHNIEKMAEENCSFELSLDTFQKTPSFFDDIRKILIEIAFKDAKKQKTKAKDSKKNDSKSPFRPSIPTEDEEIDPTLNNLQAQQKTEEEKCIEATYIEYAIRSFLDNMELYKQNLQNRLREKRRQAKRYDPKKIIDCKDIYDVFEGREIFNFFKQYTQSSSICDFWGKN